MGSTLYFEGIQAPKHRAMDNTVSAALTLHCTLLGPQRAQRAHGLRALVTRDILATHFPVRSMPPSGHQQRGLMVYKTRPRL